LILSFLVDGTLFSQVHAAVFDFPSSVRLEATGARGVYFLKLLGHFDGHQWIYAKALIPRTSRFRKTRAEVAAQLK
jgi:hypothetical protein